MKHQNSVIIDSIQTIYNSEIDIPGSVSQIKYSAEVLIKYAKGKRSIPLLLTHNKRWCDCRS